jgi:hypothetical protein
LTAGAEAFPALLETVPWRIGEMRRWVCRPVDVSMARLL